mmetsp:Transcript_51133/g.119804  ORF Transcript_51133/g.119804 Transcript_51133/m.119804 type:complete len:175 (+) Transcript_51133:184-708(+)
MVVLDGVAAKVWREDACCGAACIEGVARLRQLDTTWRGTGGVAVGELFGGLHKPGPGWPMTRKGCGGTDGYGPRVEVSLRGDVGGKMGASCLVLKAGATTGSGGGVAGVDEGPALGGRKSPGTELALGRTRLPPTILSRVGTCKDFSAQALAAGGIGGVLSWGQGLFPLRRGDM